MPKRPALPVMPPARDHGHRLTLAEADPAAEEHDGQRALPTIRLSASVASARCRLHAAEREDTLAFEKEVALLGKEQVEPRQVDLLDVLLDLREIGVVGDVGDQAARQPVLEVDADIRSTRLL